MQVGVAGLQTELDLLDYLGENGGSLVVVMSQLELGRVVEGQELETTGHRQGGAQGLWVERAVTLCIDLHQLLLLLDDLQQLRQFGQGELVDRYMVPVEVLVLHIRHAGMVQSVDGRLVLFDRLVHSQFGRLPLGHPHVVLLVTHG